MEPEERFAALAKMLARDPGVTLPESSGRRRFGSEALKFNGAIFAMLTGGQLVVKLPRDRVDALVANGTGLPFDAGKGRPMKEWVAVAVEGGEQWAALAQDALDFSRSRSDRS